MRSPEEWRWIPGALEGLAMLAGAGIRVSVATNQSGVGRGIMTSGDLESVHAHMLERRVERGWRDQCRVRVPACARRRAAGAVSRCLG